MKKRIIIGVVAVVLIFLLCSGLMVLRMIKQTNNEEPIYWEKEILNIESGYDRYEDVDIVFVGSSSIRKWETLANDFSEYNVVNHGFGGSKVADTTYYFDRIVTPFSPEAVVVFAGTNDIHGITKTSKSGEEVFELVKELYIKSQEELTGIPLYYISISPTTARWKVWEEADKANQLIKQYAATHKYLVFIDTTEELLKDGEPNKALFGKGGLHLNEDGYELWTSVIKPIVSENLN